MTIEFLHGVSPEVARFDGIMAWCATGVVVFSCIMVALIELGYQRDIERLRARTISTPPTPSAPPPPPRKAVVVRRRSSSAFYLPRAKRRTRP